MANNRAFLVNKETGRAVCVMKALGGWYPPRGIKAKLELMEF